MAPLISTDLIKVVWINLWTLDGILERKLSNDIYWRMAMGRDNMIFVFLLWYKIVLFRF